MYIHVDDFVFMHQSEDVVNRAALAVLSVLEEWGFVVVFTSSYRATKVIGFDTASSPAGLEIPLARLGDLDPSSKHQGFIQGKNCISMKRILIIYPHWPPSNLVGVHRVRLIANETDPVWKSFYPRK